MLVNILSWLTLWNNILIHMFIFQPNLEILAAYVQVSKFLFTLLSNSLPPRPDAVSDPPTGAVLHHFLRTMESDLSSFHDSNQTVFDQQQRVMIDFFLLSFHMVCFPVKRMCCCCCVKNNCLDNIVISWEYIHCLSHLMFIMHVMNKHM